MVAHFSGRTGELAALTGLLDQAGDRAARAVVISAIGGTAGVGKTALAVYWAHQVAQLFPAGQLYVNLRGYDPDQPMLAGDALAGFLRMLPTRAGRTTPPAWPPLCSATLRLPATTQNSLPYAPRPCVLLAAMETARPRRKRFMTLPLSTWSRAATSKQPTCCGKP